MSLRWEPIPGTTGWMSDEGTVRDRRGREVFPAGGVLVLRDVHGAPVRLDFEAAYNRAFPREPHDPR